MSGSSAVVEVAATSFSPLMFLALAGFAALASLVYKVASSKNES
jgi:hypothetical protein